MSQILTFENTLLAKSGKQGVLPPIPGPEGKGYYRLPAGGFNIPNRQGIAYRFNDYLRECMHPDSDLNRRISNGQVFAELGHPVQYYLERIGGQVVRTRITELFEWINRLRTIEQDNVCAHIRKIHWQVTGNGGPNDPVYNDIELIPFGDKKAWVVEGLQHPDVNLCVSIRSVTQPQQFGDKVREIEYFTTYDVPVEQGMLRACKHLAAGLEGFLSDIAACGTEYSTTKDELIHAVEEGMKNPTIMAGLEGTESFDRLNGFLTAMKNLPHKAPIQLVHSNSLSLFR